MIEVEVAPPIGKSGWICMNDQERNQIEERDLSIEEERGGRDDSVELWGRLSEGGGNMGEEND